MPDSHRPSAAVPRYVAVRPGTILTPDTPASDDQVARVSSYLRRLARSGFYGSASISFQHGSIVNVRVEQSYKPQNLPSSVPTTAYDAVPSSENPRGNNHGDTE
jgi:hypothetical protein